MAVRSTELASKFRTQFPSATIQVWPLEMESYDSIHAFPRRAVAELSRIDMAILNAGMQTAYFSTVLDTGHEKLVQVNYLSIMLLGILLLLVLKAKSPPGQPGRSIIVSSGTSRGAKISEPNGAPVLSALDDKSRPWDPIERYALPGTVLQKLFV
ncbi:hypothetical protein F5Y06DRAFT_300741 [Hypoxylon sp. FL0890]|nr:hypothetical protein F5Y06DRAFT_300741 [Hypoxylon sp. FL0890]